MPKQSLPIARCSASACGRTRAAITRSNAQRTRAWHFGRELSAITATPALLTAARNEHAAIQNLQVRLEASQPALTVAYFAGAKGRLNVDGQELEDGHVLRPSRRMVIAIDNVGTLSIDPGDAQTLEDISADLDAHREQLRAILERSGAVDLAGLTEYVERRQAIAGGFGAISHREGTCTRRR